MVRISCVNEQVVNGYTIPVGHNVFVSPTANHRLPDTWDEPELFKPDRYTSNNKLYRKKLHTVYPMLYKPSLNNSKY